MREVEKKMDNTWFQKHDDIFYGVLKVLLCESINSSKFKIHLSIFLKDEHLKIVSLKPSLTLGTTISNSYVR